MEVCRRIIIQSDCGHMYFSLIFLAAAAIANLFLASSLINDFKSTGSIAGVNYPIPIDPIVNIDNNQWLYDAYLVILGRMEDAVGYVTNLNAVASIGRQGVYNSFVTSAGFFIYLNNIFCLSNACLQKIKEYHSNSFRM